MSLLFENFIKESSLCAFCGKVYFSRILDMQRELEVYKDIYKLYFAQMAHCWQVYCFLNTNLLLILVAFHLLVKPSISLEFSQPLFPSNIPPSLVSRASLPPIINLNHCLMISIGPSSFFLILEAALFAASLFYYLHHFLPII